jgi:hypothetical protein
MKDRPLCHSPLLILDVCCFHVDIPVELSMIIRQYCPLRTTLDHVATLEGHTAFLMFLLASPSDERLYSASWDKTIKVWDTLSNTCLATLEGHTNSVGALAISPLRHRLYSGSRDKSSMNPKDDSIPHLMTQPLGYGMLKRWCVFTYYNVSPHAKRRFGACAIVPPHRDCILEVAAAHWMSWTQSLMFYMTVSVHKVIKKVFSVSVSCKMVEHCILHRKIRWSKFGTQLRMDIPLP